MVSCTRLGHPPSTSRLNTSPGSHSAITSNGRQQISQSVVNRCVGLLVSTTRSKACPQKGHWIVSVTSIFSCVETHIRTDPVAFKRHLLPCEMPAG